MTHLKMYCVPNVATRHYVKGGIVITISVRIVCTLMGFASFSIKLSANLTSLGYSINCRVTHSFICGSLPY